MIADQPHEITQRRTPINVLALCSCGWSHRETRRQNAWARASKLTAAINKHINEAAAVARSQGIRP